MGIYNGNPWDRHETGALCIGLYSILALPTVLAATVVAWKWSGEDLLQMPFHGYAVLITAVLYLSAYGLSPVMVLWTDGGAKHLPLVVQGGALLLGQILLFTGNYGMPWSLLLVASAYLAFLLCLLVLGLVLRRGHRKPPLSLREQGSSLLRPRG